MKKLLNSPGQLKARLADAKEKLKKTQEKLKKAQGPDGDDESEDYWGEIEMKQAQEVEKLEKKLRDAK